MIGAVPSLAVVIPNFNYARFLPRALESTLGQTQPFDEIVVVDDGSTDNSLEVLASYGGRVRVVSIPNGGQLGACYAGFLATSADYIYFLDSDDFATQDLVATVRLALRARPAKLQFQLYSVDVEGAAFGSVFPTYPLGYTAEVMRHDNAVIGFYQCPTTSGNVFSRGALAQIDLARLNPRDFIDGSPALAMPYIGEVVSLNRALAHYRIHGHSVSAWTRPSVAVLLRELEMFHRRWQEVVQLLGMPGPPFAQGAPLYLSERAMLLACLEGRPVIVPQVGRFLSGLMATNFPMKQKILLSLWAVGLVVPSRRLRDSLIRSKRSSANRSRGLRSIINFATGARAA